jgi:hypothetical protein
MKRIFDESRLELERQLTNFHFPDCPVDTIEEMKRIIIKEERKRGISVAEHNRKAIEMQVRDYILD